MAYVNERLIKWCAAWDGVMSKDLNPKRKRFVQEFLVDCNATQAAIRAGYSKRTANVTGSQLLAIPSIKAAVQAGQAKAAERAQINVDNVIKRPDEAARRAKHNDDAANEIRALELLGKHVGAFTERWQIGFSNLSDEELERRIQEKLGARS